MSRLFKCRVCDGTGLIRWSGDPQDACVCGSCEQDEVEQLCDSPAFLQAPFEVVLTKLPDGRWAASPKDSYHTYAEQWPEAAFYVLMKALGWRWTGRWERWVTS